MNALLSIKPEYGEKILIGEKRYEFRRTMFSDPSSVEYVILYSSSPLQRVIGAFSFSRVIQDTPEDLWSSFGEESGIETRQQFLDYFSGTKTGYAIEISDVVVLDDPVDPRNLIDDFSPPVSFEYVNGEFDPVFEALSHGDSR